MACGSRSGPVGSFDLVVSCGVGAARPPRPRASNAAMMESFMVRTAMVNRQVSGNFCAFSLLRGVNKICLHDINDVLYMSLIPLHTKLCIPRNISQHIMSACDIPLPDVHLSIALVDCCSAQLPSDGYEVVSLCWLLVTQKPPIVVRFL